MVDEEKGVVDTGSLEKRLGFNEAEIKRICAKFVRGVATKDDLLEAAQLIERLYAAWIAADEDAKLQKEFLAQADPIGWPPLDRPQR